MDRSNRLVILTGALDESSPPAEQLDIFTLFTFFVASVSVWIMVMIVVSLRVVVVGMLLRGRCFGDLGRGSGAEFHEPLQIAIVAGCIRAVSD